MNRRARLLLALTAALAAACSGGKKSHFSQIYATGGGANRILVSGDSAFIANSLDDTIDKIDLTTCTPCQRTGQATLPVGTDPIELMLSGGTLYATGYVSNQVLAIDPVTMSVTATVSTGAFAFSNPESMVTSGAFTWVSNVNGYPPGPGFVVVASNGTLVHSIDTTAKSPFGFTALPGGTVAVVDEGVFDFNTGVATTDGAIDILDATHVVDTIPIGKHFPGPAPILTQAQDALVMGAGGGSADVLRVTLAGSATQQVTVAAGSFTTWVEDVDGVVYVLSFLDDRVYTLDDATLAPVTITGHDQPFIAVGPGGAALRGPVHAAVWNDGTNKHLLVLLTAANAVTDILLP